MGKKRYGVILADPPWHFKVYSQKGAGRSAESHYPTMNIEDIKALPVSDIADKDCALFLWVTFPCLLEGLEVIKAWGFTYKTVAFVWVKQNKKSESLFWAWDTGHAATWSFAYWQQGADRSVSMQECIRWLCPISRNTAGNQRKSMSALSGSWAVYPKSSFLPGEKRTGLMYGEMKWKVTLI